MSSRSGSALASNQRPRVHVAPPSDQTFGDLAATFAADYGLTPDPWQQIVLDDWLAEFDGRYAALTCGLACPRQNGKNAILEVRELFGMVGRGEKILHTAHEVKTARKAFKRLLHFFGRKVNDPAAKFPELNALVTELRQVNGQEAIFLSNGGSVEIVARSQGSGRGFTVDTLVLDEAQDLSDDDLEALMPTTSSAPLGNPQWIYTGTPPGPRARGDVFTRLRVDALGGLSSRLAWHEWSVDATDLEEIDLDSRDVWFATNPALGERLQIEVVEGERVGMSPEGFARERLGWWQPAALKNAAALPFDRWLTLSDPDAPRGADPMFGVDVDVDRMASIGVAWSRPDGARQVMIADSVPAHALVARCAELSRQWGGRVVAPPAVADELERAGVSAESLNTAGFTAACGAFADAVTAGSVRHGNQPVLNQAVQDARWRDAGVSGERAFRLRNAPTVGPLAAAARALHGLSTRPSVYERRDLLVI